MFSENYEDVGGQASWSEYLSEKVSTGASTVTKAMRSMANSKEEEFPARTNTGGRFGGFSSQDFFNGNANSNSYHHSSGGSGGIGNNSSSGFGNSSGGFGNNSSGSGFGNNSNNEGNTYGGWNSSNGGWNPATKEKRKKKRKKKKKKNSRRSSQNALDDFFSDSEDDSDVEIDKEKKKPSSRDSKKKKRSKKKKQQAVESSEEEEEEEERDQSEEEDGSSDLEDYFVDDIVETKKESKKKSKEKKNKKDSSKKEKEVSKNNKKEKNIKQSKDNSSEKKKRNKNEKLLEESSTKDLLDLKPVRTGRPDILDDILGTSPSPQSQNHNNKDKGMDIFSMTKSDQLFQKGGPNSPHSTREQQQNSIYASFKTPTQPTMFNQPAPSFSGVNRSPFMQAQPIPTFPPTTFISQNRHAPPIFHSPQNMNPAMNLNAGFMQQPQFQSKQPIFANKMRQNAQKKKVTSNRSNLSLEEQMNSTNFNLGTFI